MSERLPSRAAPTDDPARQQRRAKAYARAQRRLTLFGWVVGATYLGLWVGLGWAVLVRDAAAALSPSPWWIVAAVGIAIALPHELLTFPLSVYSGFRLPHRFGQSRQTFTQWLWDQTKGWAIGSFLGLLLLEGLYGIMRWQPGLWWVWAGGGILLVNILLTHLAPVLLFPLFFRFIPVDNAELQQRLLDLCRRAGTGVRGVFTFDLGRKTRAANAALAGLGNTRRILLSDTLCEQYTPDEIEVILAHELGHHLHGHLWKGIALSTISTLGAFGLTHLMLGAVVGRLSLTGIADPAGLPVLAVVLGAISLAGMPIGNSISRGFERQADAEALQLASQPRAMISAMEKLADHNLADREPHPVVEWWFHSHPSINNRISAAQTFVDKSSAGV